MYEASSTNHDPERDEQIRVAVAQFFAAWNRTPDEDQLSAWVPKLRPHWGKAALRQALSDLMQSPEHRKWTPSIPEVLARVEQLSAPTRNAATWKPLTLDERRKAKHAAMLSLLWLHYEFGWSLDGASPAIAHFDPDTRRAAALATAKYDREHVRNWMREQAIADPLPCDRALSSHL